MINFDFEPYKIFSLVLIQIILKYLILISTVWNFGPYKYFGSTIINVSDGYWILSVICGYCCWCFFSCCDILHLCRVTFFGGRFSTFVTPLLTMWIEYCIKWSKKNPILFSLMTMTNNQHNNFLRYTLLMVT